MVTGAARGIGLAVATAMLDRGSAVEVWDLPTEQLAQSERELAARFPGRVAARGLDVSELGAVRAAAAAAEAAGPVDVLVNGAGISSHRRPAIDIAEEDWARMLAVNLSGPWNTCRALGRAMLARGRGSVINIASTNSIDPSPGIAHYCVSKAGVAMLTKCLALEWASAGVRVNAVGPGPVKTPMTMPILEADPAVRARWESRVPLGRIGDPADLVGMFVYLASDASTWVTGQVFYVEGGWLLS
ncbi:MAG TPA: SDR family oxidoreductase [Methylomirabilota bacterium]|nr:SDR family oxidoreductase [Methylomirabilota bacterium]